jgi:putative ABC transport system ATP-binding protein
MIRLENITLKSGNQTILENISLHLQAGEKVALKGPSGCGKSSLLKIVAGAIKPHSGTVRFNGDALSAETIPKIRSALAFIGQEPVCGAETVRETLLLPFQFKAHAQNRPHENTVLETLSRLHLPAGILTKKCARISGGEKQRVAIARAFLLGKTIFIADEITSALDPVSKAAVLDQLFRPEFTIISASHDPDWLSACTRTLEMNNGKITGDHHADR